MVTHYNTFWRHFLTIFSHTKFSKVLHCKPMFINWRHNFALHSWTSLTSPNSSPGLLNIHGWGMDQSMIRMLMTELCCEFLSAVACPPYEALTSAALQPEGLEPALCFQGDHASSCCSFNALLRPGITVHIPWKQRCVNSRTWLYL